MKRPVALIVIGAAAVALLAAGCGDSGESSSAKSSDTLSLASTGLGKVLVGPNGHILYLFEKDKGGKSACAGACAAEWPPLTATGKPSAGPGVDAEMLSVTKGSGGKSQVVYGGHPLYYYTADTGAGDTNGQGLDAFGAEWYAVSATGAKVEESGGSEAGGSTEGGSRY
jgi:predicted lipoprotein with Yx(FWY)xxD motif